MKLNLRGGGDATLLNSILIRVLRLRLLVLGAAAALVVLGVIGLRQMHSDVLPELGSGPVLEVQTEALGLSSQEVEQYLTVPLENNLLDGIMGVWDVRSNSIAGLSTVDLYFQPGVTTLHARQLVQERLANAFALPHIASPPQLIQPLSSSSRAMTVGRSSPSLSPLELSYLARWVVQPRLAGVPGVANVTIFGQRDRQIQVLVDPARLAANHLTLDQIIRTAGNAQLVSPLSYLEGSSPGTGGFLDGPNQRLEIRPVLPLGAPRNLASVPISGAPGRQTLGSVAQVVLGNQPLIGDAVTSGRAQLVLLVQKLPSASLLGVTRGIERALRNLRPALSGVSIDTSLFRPAGYVTDSLDNLELAGLIAAGLLLIALVALLRSARAVLIAAVSVALSLLGAAALLDLLGYTLNTLVILGLLMALAVVVDDAVAASSAVAALATRRRRSAGREPLGDALIETLAALRSPLGYATLIVLIAVAPVFFSKGLSATFVHPMLLAYALAVIVSMVIALTVTPALAMLVFERVPARRRGAAAGGRARAAYAGLIHRTFGVPRLVLLALTLVGLAGIVAIPFLRQPAAPTFKDRNLIVDWNGPAGASLREMDRVTARVVGSLRALPAVADAGAVLGRAIGADRIVGAGSGEVFVRLRPGADYDRAVAAVRGIVNGVPGIDARVTTYEHEVLRGVLAPAGDQATIRLYGQDFAELGRLAGRVAGVMSSVDGLGPAHVHAQPQAPNIEVRVSDAAALKAGVLPGDARRQASTLVSGLTVGNFFQDQAVFDVVVRGIAAVRDDVGAVNDLLIDTEDGGHVRLGQVAQVSIHPDPLDIQHEALSRYVDVSAAVYVGSIAHAQNAVLSKLRAIGFPTGYRAEAVGGTPEDPTSRAAFMSYVLAAAVGILLLLQAAFRSWRLAALFFLLLPLAISGGLIVAVASGNADSVGADAGLVAALAFAVRQGMLLIGAVRDRQFARGLPLTRELVLEAAGSRAEPAFGSALGTAVALVPFVVLGATEGNELGHVAAAVLLGALLSATIVSMLVLPAVCLALGPAGPPDGAEEAGEEDEHSGEMAPAEAPNRPLEEVTSR